MSKESSLLYVDEHASTFRTCVCTVGLGTIISLSFAEFLRGENARRNKCILVFLCDISRFAQGEFRGETRQ